MSSGNSDERTVQSFGDEWTRFSQSAVDEAESRLGFEGYFRLFPWHLLPANAQGFDMGCGSGRWARFVAPRVGRLHCIDPSSALLIAQENLKGQANVTFHRAAVDTADLPPASQDFGYSLGVLHHVPDTAAAIRSCARLLKPGAPLLLYLYYAFDNQPWWFRALWRASDGLRRGISLLPPGLKHTASEVIAALVYWPLARSSAIFERLGLDVRSFPLSFYRDRSFYTMRTDARDRFGTPLEQRFSRAQISAMMLGAGLGDVRFSETAPYWCAVGTKH